VRGLARIRITLSVRYLQLRLGFSDEGTTYLLWHAYIDPSLAGLRLPQDDKVFRGWDSRGGCRYVGVFTD
jgi:hypothetical protein